MAQLPAQAAIVRFTENENRLDKFVNDPASYTNSAGAVVESIPAFINRKEDEIDAVAAIATTAANVALSQTARVGAESARDASLIQAGVYVDEPTGRAAVADGVAFKVQGLGDIAAYEYRRTNSAASVLIASYPSKFAIDNKKIGLNRSTRWIYAIVDANKRILFGINSLGKSFASSLSVAIMTVTTSFGIGSLTYRISRSSKYPLVYLAADHKTVLGGLDKDGYWFWRVRAVASDLMASTLAIGSTLFRLQRSGKYPLAYLAADHRTLIGGLDREGYWFWRTRPIRRITAAASTKFSAYTVISANAANCKIYAQDASTGMLSKVYDGAVYYEITQVVGSDILCRDAMNNVVTFSSNAGPSNKLLAPVDKIMAIGDSLTGGAMDGPTLIEYPTRLKALIDAARGTGSFEVNNTGVGGQTASEIAARFGGATVILTITGNTIPEMITAGTYVYTPVMTRNLNPLTSQGFVSMPGWIAGVQVYLTRNSDNSYKVSRLYPGASVTVPSSATFVPDFEFAWNSPDLRQRVSILWLGQNGVSTTSPTDLIAYLMGCVAQLKTVNTRFLIPTIVTAETGSLVADLNAAIRSAYPGNIVEVRSMLMANGNGGATDNADIASGNVPTSLRLDGIHLNAAGHDLVAQLFFNTLTSKGWI